MLPIEVILEQTDKKSDDFVHQIPENECISDIGKDTIYWLDRVFGDNITIGDSANDTNTIIHDIDVDIWPSK